MTTRQTRATLEWMTEALCATTRPDLPWLSDGHLVREDDINTMARVCRRCPVFAQCTRHVVANKVTGGYWAGRQRETDPALPLRRSA